MNAIPMNAMSGSIPYSSSYAPPSSFMSPPQSTQRKIPLKEYAKAEDAVTQQENGKARIQSQTQVPRACWTFVEEELLVKVYAEYMVNKKMKKMNKNTWEAIAERLFHDSRENLTQVSLKTWMQCKDKWNNMVKKYKNQRTEYLCRLSIGEHRAVEREGVFEALERILNYENNAGYGGNADREDAGIDNEHESATMVTKEDKVLESQMLQLNENTTPEPCGNLTPQRSESVTSPTVKTATPQRYEIVTPQDTLKPQHIHNLTEQPKEILKAQYCENQMMQRRETSQHFENATPQRNEHPTPQHFENVAPQHSENQMPQHFENATPQRSENPTLQRFENVAQQRSEHQTPQRFENVAQQRSEQPIPQHFENVAPQRSENPTPQRFENVAPQRSENPTPHRRRTLTPRRRATISVEQVSAIQLNAIQQQRYDDYHNNNEEDRSQEHSTLIEGNETSLNHTTLEERPSFSASPLASLKRTTDRFPDQTCHKKPKEDHEETSMAQKMHDILLRQTELLEHMHSQHNELIEQVKVSEENTRMMLLQAIKQLGTILERLIKTEDQDY